MPSDGTPDAVRGVTTRTSARYFVASVVLLVVVVGVYAATTARRTQAELRAQLEQTAHAIADAVNVASVNALRASQLVERMIADRLMDNARLVDTLVTRPVPPGLLASVAEQNGLRRIDLLDLEGRPWTPPAPPAMPGMGPPDGHRPMMPFMWGPRWRRMPQPPAEVEAPPAVVKDRKFWDGTVYGVAIGARSFRGIIAVHADAAYVLNFRRDVGVDRLLADFGRQPGVEAVTLFADDLTILADSDPVKIGGRIEDAPAVSGAVESRFVEEGGVRYFEVLRALPLDGERVGRLRVRFSTDAMTRAWRRDVVAGGVLAGAALTVAGLGLGAIFWVQRRHLADVRGLEANLAQRDRLAAVGDMAAAFAHEVRNPLNAVSVGLQRLRAEFAPEPAADYARCVTLMQEEARRLNAIVEQFIAMARPLPLKPAPFAIADLLRELSDLVEGDARAAGVAVRVAVADALPVVTADRDHVKQVLLNLVLNAIQAMPGGGAVTIGASAGRGTVAVTVDDTGPGIPADVRGRVFDPYFTTKKNGLGLGLTIARRIAEAHGGALTVEPRAGGTRFRLTLPQDAT
jgi:signal transduction histidine kinase